MAFESNEAKEKIYSSRSSVSPTMSLQKAVDMGEYNPDFLATFPEWHTLSKHLQLQYIRQGLDNRRRHLIVQWAEINNVLDFRTKPHLKVALRNIEKQIKKLDSDMEKIYLEYSR